MLGFTGTSVSRQLEVYLSDLRPAGVILFSRNLDSAAQMVDLTNRLQKLVGPDQLLQDRKSTRLNSSH